MEAILIANRRRPLGLDALPHGLAAVEARGASHALRLAGEALARGVRRILVAGGDGSVQAVLPALAGSGAVLGIVPRGTGNDLAGCLGLPREPGEAIAVALEAEPRPIDLLRLEGGGGRALSAVAVTMGAAVRVQGRLDAWRRARPHLARFLGRAGFVATALAEAVAPEPLEARVTWEGGSWEGPLLGLVLLMRSRYAGGFPAPAGGGAGDGRFRAILLRDPGGAARRLSLAADLRAGRVQGPDIAIFEGGRVRLHAERPVAVSLDGAYRRRRDPALRVLPGALLVAAPPATARGAGGR